MDAYLSALVRRGGAPARGLPAACQTMATDWRIRLLAREGDVDGAFAELAKPRLNSRRIIFSLYYPELKALRRDPRFMQLAHRIGLTGYWLKSGRWPDFCAEPDLPYDCKAVARALEKA